MLVLLAEDAGVLIARAHRAFAHRAVDRVASDMAVRGPREAERYRLPFQTVAESKSNLNDASGERKALLPRTDRIGELGPLSAGGGFSRHGVGSTSHPGSASGRARVSAVGPRAL